ncbi:ATP-binding protein [Piscinibacter sp. HJYY11]|uniref:ATP-binding response regulator n=1 Tax=Piscinibacter sp. HJYY11 TaxID=2801333 RepID=UPI0019201BA2|nr:ATP-binding protein [Piscinibacter sp. HJYY11]MBL0726427.1 response regulator [Piscinibacter sp. HJYY11]
MTLCAMPLSRPDASCCCTSAAEVTCMSERRKTPPPEPRPARRLAEPDSFPGSEFPSTLSHELRTPLNAILGYAQLLGMDEGLNEQQRRGIETIRTTGEHLLSLINDVLDLSKLGADGHELVLAPVQIAPFLASAADVLRAKAGEKNLVLGLDVDPKLPVVVLADELRLRQVLLNLLGNALRFTDHGSVTLCARDEGREGRHALVRIEVRDTGVGIQPEDLPLIFQPFKQVGDAQRREGGTGLGLTVARALVTAMGGHIDVTSEPGRGTQFSFQLRLQLADTGEREAWTPSLPAHPEGRRPRVLVIDDVAHNRDMLVDFLIAAGYDIESADDGQQGMDKVRIFHPELIVMDSVMPGISGLQVTRMLRASSTYSTLPIIVVSADATEQHLQDCLQAGASVCLTKPVRLDRLAAAIQQLLHQPARLDRL